MIEISSILAPTDFSTHSERAVRYACQLAERLNAPLHLLHVLSEIVPAGPDPLLMPVMPPQFYKENEDRAVETLSRLPDPTWEKPPFGRQSSALGKPGRLDRLLCGRPPDRNDRDRHSRPNRVEPRSSGLGRRAHRA